MLTVIEIHISHLRFNLKVIRIYHIQRFLSAKFIFTKKNLINFRKFTKKSTNLQKKNSKELYQWDGSNNHQKNLLENKEKS